MLSRSLLAAAAAALVAVPAYANQCPSMAAEIDETLASAELSEEVRAEVQALRDEGMQQHEAGQHAESMETLAEAQSILEENTQ